MSAKQSKVAATYSGAGIRAEAKKSKVVFKNVLDTPFNIPWPEISNDNNAIVLDVLCELLHPIKSYHHTHSAEINKEKKSKKKEAKEKSKKTTHEVTKPNPALAATATPSLALNPTTTEIPHILTHTVIGINSVTKELEKSIQNIKDHPPPSAVYVCKGDLSPSHLYSHIGTMVAMLPGTLLFPLTRGSEKKLSEALGMQAVGAVAIKAASVNATDLVMVTSRMVEPINVPWLPKASALVVEDKAPVTTKPATAPAGSGSDIKAIALSEPTSSTLNKSIGSTKDGNAQSWIPTNIKAVKTTMPIVTKTPQKPNSNPNPNNDSANQGKQKQQNQQKGSNNNLNHNQMNKGKKHPSDPSDQGEGGKGKKAKNK
ncbi:hypothetical protein BGZ52_012316 [Haplosporangium bisporale]|nr:hypothetical protein BGZ52_012316 [Haplosporangium bisporale]KAI9233134.1 MAG: hypothetical protein BYD32DRAFT_490696 [Podila humilis]